MKKVIRKERELHRIHHKIAIELYKAAFAKTDCKNYNRTQMRMIKAFLIKEDYKFAELDGKLYLGSGDKYLERFDAPFIDHLRALYA